MDRLETISIKDIEEHVENLEKFMCEEAKNLHAIKKYRQLYNTILKDKFYIEPIMAFTEYTSLRFYVFIYIIEVLTIIKTQQNDDEFRKHFKNIVYFTELVISDYSSPKIEFMARCELRFAVRNILQFMKCQDRIMFYDYLKKFHDALDYFFI